MKTKTTGWNQLHLLIVIALSITGCKTDEKIATKDPVISWANPADIAFGTLLGVAQFNATADVPGTFVYTPPAGTKLSLGANQNLTANFTPNDTVLYNRANKTVKINVTAAIKTNPVITWINPADIIFGELLSAIQLNATADIPGTFVYTPVLGTKLSTGSNLDLKVDFTPTDTANYSPTSKTVKINVLSSGTATDADGNVYHSVTIGNQIWLIENLKTTKLNDGTAIPMVTDSVAWETLSTPAYCWYNNDGVSNKTIYGGLYNWAAVNTGKLCPKGWHVPTETEWTTLTDYLGGISVAGGKLKETGLTHWQSPNGAATNETGFLALPGGCRDDKGQFVNITYYGSWWSSTSFDVISAWCVYMYYNYGNTSSDYDEKTYGFSIRCVKD